MSPTFGANPSPVPAADVADSPQLAPGAAKVFQPRCVGARTLPLKDSRAKLETALGLLRTGNVHLLPSLVGSG
jgi:hypothetical protein